MNEELFYDEHTLTKVYLGLKTAGIEGQDAVNAVSSIVNQGIVFRERLLD